MSLGDRTRQAGAANLSQGCHNAFGDGLITPGGGLAPEATDRRSQFPQSLIEVIFFPAGVPLLKHRCVRRAQVRWSRLRPAPATQRPSTARVF